MERSKQIAAIAQTQDERMLLVRCCDQLERARQRNTCVATSFLSQREQALLRILLPNVSFFGGTEQAERAVAYYLPDYMYAEDYLSDGPIACLRASFRTQDTLTHRDILGALLGTGLRRDAVGDICLHEDFCDVFVLSELKRYLLDNFTSAGRVRLCLQQIPLSEAARTPIALKRQHITVSSARLDGVLSATFHLSRGSAVDAIRAGLVACNHLICQKPDKQVQENDEISMRGKGKFRVLEFGSLSRRGRLAVEIGIYQ